LQANLIHEFPKDTLPDVTALKQYWKETYKNKVQDIQSLSQANLEFIGIFL